MRKLHAYLVYPIEGSPVGSNRELGFVIFKMMKLQFLVLALLTLVFAIVSVNAQELPATSDVVKDGAGGFPQKSAHILVDTSEIRVSIVNDSKYLAVQAILWKDGNASNKKKRDYSYFGFSSDEAGKRRPQIDRSYSLDPNKDYIGLHYQSYLGQREVPHRIGGEVVGTYLSEVHTVLKKDTAGRGKIVYLPVKEGGQIRVDSMLIPLAELAMNPAGGLRGCFFSYSSKPELRFNSCNYTSTSDYYGSRIPFEFYRPIPLEKGLQVNLSELFR